jgi:hypothetical protein
MLCRVAGRRAGTGFGGLRGTCENSSLLLPPRRDRACLRPRRRELVPPARLQLALLDPQVLRELRLVAGAGAAGAPIVRMNSADLQDDRVCEPYASSWRFLLSIDDFALATVAKRRDKAGGPPRQVLRATGQPPAARRGHSVQRTAASPPVSQYFPRMRPLRLEGSIETRETRIASRTKSHREDSRKNLRMSSR